MSFSDPAIAKLAPNEPWLAPEGLRKVVELWRGALPVDDPMVSPINGDLTGLGPIMLFSGTRDILNADVKRLVQKARATDCPLDYHEGPGLLHAWPVMPIPESKAARAIMAQAITR